MHYRITSRAFFAVLLVGLAGCRTEIRSSRAAVLSGATADALSADAGRLTADVAWLADDAREGRRAGTEAALDAGRWIGARFEQLGLEPAGENGTWFQEFEVPLQARDGGGSSVGHEGKTFQGPSQVVPLFCSAGGEFEGPLAWVGYGIHAPDLGRDDYDGRKVGGAIAVMLRGVPDQPPAVPAQAKHAETVVSAPSWEGHGSIFFKVMTAKRQGARAVLLVQSPDDRDGALMSFDASRQAQSGIPALMISSSTDTALRAGDAGSPPPRARIVADVRRGKGPATNVLARLRGRSRGRTVVIGAHYDHLGRGGDGSLAPDEQGQIHNGADDNASGSAAVLEMARILKAGRELEGDVVFALWSGEELGLLGSEYWAQHPTVALRNVRANLNLDMVGRAGDGELSVLGVGTARAFEDWMEPAGRAAGLDLQLNKSGQGVGGSDHQSFIKRSIPALHLFSGVHTDYHKPSDDVERFESDGARRVTDLGVELVRRMLSARSLAWVEPEREPASPGAAARAGPAGSRVWFGTVPEYTYEGRGLLLSGTSAGSPAEKAGLIAGDVLIQVGDVEIGTIYDFMYALGTYKPGDVVLTRYLRDGVEEEVRVTLSTRDVQ
jgi:hypothetical protein